MTAVSLVTRKAARAEAHACVRVTGPQTSAPVRGPQTRGLVRPPERTVFLRVRVRRPKHKLVLFCDLEVCSWPQWEYSPRAQAEAGLEPSLAPTPGTPGTPGTHASSQASGSLRLSGRTPAT